MVRINDYLTRKTEQGEEFFVLELQGEIQMVKSKETGNFYVTARKATISCTFDELTCKALIGTEMPGSIAKSNCEEYEYTIKDTGEVIILSHRFEYVEAKTTAPTVEKSTSTMETFMENVSAANAFSSNGELTH